MNESIQNASHIAWKIWSVSVEPIVNTNKIVYTSENITFIMSLSSSKSKRLPQEDLAFARSIIRLSLTYTTHTTR